MSNSEQEMHTAKQLVGRSKLDHSQCSTLAIERVYNFASVCVNKTQPFRITCQLNKGQASVYGRIYINRKVLEYFIQHSIQPFYHRYREREKISQLMNPSQLTPFLPEYDKHNPPCLSRLSMCLCMYPCDFLYFLVSGHFSLNITAQWLSDLTK